MAMRLQPADPEARSALRALRQGNSLPPASPPRGKTGPLRISVVEDILKTEVPASDIEGEVELDDPEEAAKDLALTLLAGMLFEDSSEEGEEDEDQTTRVMEPEPGEKTRVTERSDEPKTQITVDEPAETPPPPAPEPEQRRTPEELTELLKQIKPPKPIS